MVKFPYLIFELGKLQVFTYRTQEEAAFGDKMPYTNVFWQDTVSKNTYGPFDGIYLAMAHHAHLIENQKKQGAPIIYVDFKNKKRVMNVPTI